MEKDTGYGPRPSTVTVLGAVEPPNAPEPARNADLSVASLIRAAVHEVAPVRNLGERERSAFLSGHGLNGSARNRRIQPRVELRRWTEGLGQAVVCVDQAGSVRRGRADCIARETRPQRG